MPTEHVSLYASPAHLELVNDAELCAIVGLTILISTVVHGFTAAFAVERSTEETQQA
jgi:sodium/hydrogen antiporter